MVNASKKMRKVEVPEERLFCKTEAFAKQVMVVELNAKVNFTIEENDSWNEQVGKTTSKTELDLHSQAPPWNVKRQEITLITGEPSLATK